MVLIFCQQKNFLFEFDFSFFEATKNYMGFHIARPMSCTFYDLYLRLRNKSKNYLSIYPGLIQNITQGFISYNIHAISLFYLLCFS